MHWKTGRLDACAAAGLGLLASGGAFAQEAPDAELPRVVITARKQAEDLQAVPVSINALSADDLRGESVLRLSELGQMTPNLLFGQKVQSGSSAGQVYIRGIGQQDTNAAFSPGVGVYVDGVYMGRAQADDLDMSDVARVEVLYGPQGTLFGKNTNGGAINIVTRAPDPDARTAGGSVELRVGTYGLLDGLGLLNLPLAAGTAALQISAARYGMDGYSRRTDGQDQADRNRQSGRIQLLLRPAQDVEAILRLDGTSFNEHSAAYRLVAVRETSPVPSLYASSTPYRYDQRWVTSDDFAYDGTGPNRNAGSVWGSSLTLSWDRSWGNVKSITAFRRLNVHSEFDPDGSPLTVLDVFNTVRQHQFSQELQATGSSSDGKLKWVAGLYFFREAARDWQPAVVAEELFAGAANFDPRLLIVNRNYAVFGQADFKLGRQLTLTAGARLGVDQVDAQREQVGYPVPTVQQPAIERSAQWSSFLPRLSLQYQWAPRLMSYVSVSEGSKTGGYNGRASSAAEFVRFEPERVWSYEAGMRSDWLDKRLRFNASVFYSDYRDFQIQLNRSVTDPSTGLPVPLSFVGNVPKARVRGAEAELQALPISGLKLSAGLSLADGKYISVLPGAPVTTDSRFVNTPKLTYSLGAEYTHGAWTARLDYVHKSRIDYDYGNSPLVAQSPYGLLNARLNWQADGSRLSVFLFGTNLGNVHYAVGGLDDGAGGALGEVLKIMGTPRQWGCGALYRF